MLGRQSLATLGGSATYALTVARELERLGHDVTLVAEELALRPPLRAPEGFASRASTRHRVGVTP